MELKRIWVFGKYHKNMQLGNYGVKIYECDNFSLDFVDNSSINAIAYIGEEGFYFHIISLHKNGKIYRSHRFHKKYMTIVRDSIFDYYENKSKVRVIKNVY